MSGLLLLLRRTERTGGDVRHHGLLLAGKDADKDPYNVLFGTVKADDAIRLGPSKAEAFGNALLMRIKALGNAALDAMAGVFAATRAKTRPSTVRCPGHAK